MSSCEKEKSSAQLQYEKKIHCLCQQVTDYSKQIDLIHDELERTRGRLNACCRDQEELRRQINQKDDAISCYESKVEELRYELKEKEKNSQRLVDALQDKVCKFHEQIQQKDSALLAARNETKTLQSALEEMRNDFACEVQQKDSRISQMKEDLRRVYEDLKCKSDDNCQLERNMVDLKSRFHQCCCQLKEADSRLTLMQEKIQQMEFMNNKDKCQSMKDVEDFERKLAQCCTDLCNCQNENRKLKRCFQEKDEEMQNLSSERNCLTRELQNCKQEVTCQQERAANLENDNKEICRLLQQKVKCIKELENELCMKEQEVEQCQCCVDELNAKIRELNTESVSTMPTSDQTTGDKLEDNTDLVNQMKLCRDKLKKLEGEHDETLHKLDWAVKEMENMAREIKRLNCELENSRREICEKNALIGDLERTIEHAEQDMDSRMRRVDEQLQKYEREIKDKTHMIAECEEKCCRYQHALSDKEAELEQTDQRLNRATSEISCLCAKSKEIEDARDAFQKKYNEQRAQYTELCQEYKLCRDQLQSLTVECNDAKRDLGCCQRDLEKSRRDADDLRIVLQEKESAIYRLTEERNCMASKISSLQCRLETETTQLSQQLTDQRYRMEKEIEQLKQHQLELEECNGSLMQKVSTGQRQLGQLEKCYYQKVDALNRENQCLQNKVADKEDQLQATKDCITLRDSEIMRLKLRLCSLDRCGAELGKATECCQPMSGSNTMACLTGVKARRRSSSCGSGTCCAEWQSGSHRMLDRKEE